MNSMRELIRMHLNGNGLSQFWRSREHRLPVSSPNQMTPKYPKGLERVRRQNFQNSVKLRSFGLSR